MTDTTLDQPLPGMPAGPAPSDPDAERKALREVANQKCSRGHRGSLDVTIGWADTEPQQVECRTCRRTWRLIPDDGLYA